MKPGSIRAGGELLRRASDKPCEAPSLSDLAIRHAKIGIYQEALKQSSGSLLEPSIQTDVPGAVVTR